MDGETKEFLKKYFDENDRKITDFKDEIKRHFDVVAEDLESKIQLVAEGHLDINRRLDGIDGHLGEIDGRLDGIDNRLYGIDGRLDGIDGRLEGIDGKIVALSEQVAANTEDLTIIKGGLNIIKQDLKKKVDYDDFAALERRALALESRPAQKSAI
ncbi:MAG: hypothetical protein WCX69_01630 [Candidatus Paceibacterota bacterium]